MIVLSGLSQEKPQEDLCSKYYEVQIVNLPI